ncbi:hypothetical protein [Streptomyces sp. x-80]|uniref:hypothetical protein n=1 Tax=Streptomyces sp. x-80 TaxID=2789282 RepID=UPI0039802CEC
MDLGYVNAPDAPGRYEPVYAGGTSASASLVAGMPAVLNERNHRPTGFASACLYPLHGKPELRDVTDTPLGPTTRLGELTYAADNPGSVYLHAFGQDIGLSAVPGYDHVTGLGTPTSAFFTRAGRP